MDLVIAHVSKDYGRGPVLRDVSLTVRQGETVCLMGPSGLGKTTLLRCVAGLETPDAGAVTGVPRRLGYVFQEDRLLDEAFKGLDEQCRRDTAAYICRHTAGASVLCVTHDPEEATLLGGRCIDLAALQRRD